MPGRSGILPLVLALQAHQVSRRVFDPTGALADDPNQEGEGQDSDQTQPAGSDVDDADNGIGGVGGLPKPIHSLLPARSPATPRQPTPSNA